jgi:hypothetical protein
MQSHVYSFESSGDLKAKSTFKWGYILGGVLLIIGVGAIFAASGSDSLPTASPILHPTGVPTAYPTAVPTGVPTPVPTGVPTLNPTAPPTADPTAYPTADPTPYPTADPTAPPTLSPTANPTATPTATPTVAWDWKQGHLCTGIRTSIPPYSNNGKADCQAQCIAFSKVMLPTNPTATKPCCGLRGGSCLWHPQHVPYNNPVFFDVGDGGDWAFKYDYP